MIISSWAKRRRLTYVAGAIGIIIIVVIVPLFLKFYIAPTCFDGKKNQNEQGVDCGGKCEKLCASAFLPPSVDWTRFQEIAPGVYNVASYIVNPNADGEAKNVSYRIVMYDKDGIPISEKTSTFTIPPNRNSIAFLGSVSVSKRIPVKIYFEFAGIPDWNKKSDPLSAIVIEDKDFKEENNTSSLHVTVKNNSFNPIGKLSLGAILYDAEDNVLGFSKTFIDGIEPRSEVEAPFTWPISYNGKVISIEVLPVAE